MAPFQKCHQAKGLSVVHLTYLLYSMKVWLWRYIYLSALCLGKYVISGCTQRLTYHTICIIIIYMWPDFNTSTAVHTHTMQVKYTASTASSTLCIQTAHCRQVLMRYALTGSDDQVRYTLSLNMLTSVPAPFSRGMWLSQPTYLLVNKESSPHVWTYQLSQVCSSCSSNVLLWCWLAQVEVLLLIHCTSSERKEYKFTLLSHKVSAQ